jgi:hypothetical protein
MTNFNIERHTVTDFVANTLILWNLNNVRHTSITNVLRAQKPLQKPITVFNI